MTRQKTQKLLARWHRRSGVISAFFVLLLAISGVLINHGRQWGLDRHFINQPFILKFYGHRSGKISSVQSVQIDGHWLSKAGNFLYFDARRLDACSGKFVGAVELERFWVAACDNELLVYSYSQQLVQKVGRRAGLPFPVEQIGSCFAELCVAFNGKVYQLDLNPLRKREFEGEERRSLLWSSPVEPPQEIKVKLAAAMPGPRVSWWKLLHDIHAGRYLGAAGPYVMDMVALLFVVFSVTGMYLWLKGHERGTGKNQ